jgi:hypothetical protein
MGCRDVRSALTDESEKDLIVRAATTQASIVCGRIQVPLPPRDELHTRPSSGNATPNFDGVRDELDVTLGVAIPTRLSSRCYSARFGAIGRLNASGGKTLVSAKATHA